MLAKVVRWGDGHVAFMTDVAAALRSAQEEWDDIERDGTVDECWRHFPREVLPVAQGVFGGRAQRREEPAARSCARRGPNSCASDRACGAVYASRTARAAAELRRQSPARARRRR